MTMMRKLIRAEVSALGADEVQVVMSTAALARDGHVLVPQGCLLDNYRANPIVLWSHDPDKPIGNAENIVVRPDQISARIRFAPLGISHKADEIRGLMKSGVLRAVSVGFDPIEMEPLDPKRPRGGQRISVWELLELSPVSVPADTGAVVTARSSRSGKTLSQVNATALREAHDQAERCRATIANVLEGAGEGAAGRDGDRDHRRRQAEALGLQQKPLESDVRHEEMLEAARRRLFGPASNEDQRRRQLEAARLSIRF